MNEKSIYGITGIVEEEILNHIQQKISDLKVSCFGNLYIPLLGCTGNEPVGLDKSLNHEEFNERMIAENNNFKNDVEKYKKAINQFIDLQLKIHSV